MAAQRYLHTYGLTPEAFGHVAVTDRRHAATNPAAYFHGKPITLADHAASRWIVEPLRLLDCCQETDGGQALVVTTRRAGPRPAAPARRDRGGRAGRGPGAGADDQLLPRRPHRACRRWAWSPGSCGGPPGSAPADIDVGILYDHFTPFVLMQLEEFGFCAPGEAADFVAEDALPLNTHGGQLGEAYLHGMNGIAEAVRQLRGTSVNQVPGAARALVTAGTGVPTSGLILGPTAERPGGRPRSLGAPRSRVRTTGYDPSGVTLSSLRALLHLQEVEAAPPLQPEADTASGPAADPPRRGPLLAWSHDHTRLHQRFERRHAGDADPSSAPYTSYPSFSSYVTGPPAGAAAHRPVAHREPERRRGPAADRADQDVRRVGADRGPPGARRLCPPGAAEHPHLAVAQAQGRRVRLRRAARAGAGARPPTRPSSRRCTTRCGAR